MASLKKNVQVIQEGLVKNVEIVLRQAHEKARVAAFDYMKNRTTKLGQTKNEEYESVEAVIAWLTKLDTLAKEVPEVPDDEEADLLTMDEE